VSELLKEIIANSFVSLIEKKYALELLFQLFLLDKPTSDQICSDLAFLNKLQDFKRTNNSSFELNELANKAYEPKPNQIKRPPEYFLNKYVQDACDRILWASNSEEFIADSSSIMLAHSASHEPECRKIKENLEKNYFKVYADIYDADVNNMSLHSMTKHVHDCSIVVVCVAKQSQSKNYLKMLLNYANLEKKKIIPVFMEKCSPLRSTMKHLALINFFQFEFDEFVEVLIEEINKASYDEMSNSMSSLHETSDEDKTPSRKSSSGDEFIVDKNEDSTSRNSELVFSCSTADNKTTDFDLITDESIEPVSGQAQDQNETMTKPRSGNFMITELKEKKNTHIDFELPTSPGPSKWTKSQVKRWFVSNRINLTIYKCLNCCDGEALYTYFQILIVEPKFFFEELIKKRQVIANETFDADDITRFRIKLKILFD
jgi:hypothetical protein